MLHGSEPTLDELERHVLALRDAEVDSICGWHYCLLKTGRLPVESHCQWAARVLGRPVNFMDEITIADMAVLRASLWKTEREEKP